jgi:hypothetical protein
VYKTIKPSPAFNSNATIQVAYHSDGLLRATMPGVEAEPSKASTVFYQCIDVEITGGQDFPAGNFLHGLGPQEHSSPGFVDPVSGLPINNDVTVFWGPTEFAVAAVLLCFGIVCALLALMFTAKKLKGELAPADEPAFEARLHAEEKIIQKPSPPDKPETPPKPEPSGEEDDEEDATAQVNFSDGESSKTSNKSISTPKEATGSLGRHFHFRYVEEDDAPPNGPL